jgi:hypothetical protein
MMFQDLNKKIRERERETERREEKRKERNRKGKKSSRSPSHCFCQEKTRRTVKSAGGKTILQVRKK